MENKKEFIVSFIICFIFISALIYLAFSPVINTLDECERRNWDGSEYNTGVRDVKLFEESKDIIIKCNKDKSGETDAMIGIKDALLGADE